MRFLSFLLFITCMFYGSLRVFARPVCGAERLSEYLPLLKGKKVSLVINQTSRVGDALLPDTLHSLGVQIEKIFAPEHGFRGQADAGAHVANERDPNTGVSIISLYGKKKQPSASDLSTTDIVLYDIQDVGVRFYTYISTLQYVAEACAANGKMLLVLDRPDPLGHFVDGPVLDTAYRSFVGMQPIPVVYGMTPGEYVRMLKGEGWMAGAGQLRLKVIPCLEYDHKTRYELPVAPSPNLRTTLAIEAYPSLCFFEGTPVSVGRGTLHPFEIWGHPAFEGKGRYTFTPEPLPGATAPPLQGKLCWGNDMKNNNHIRDGIDLEALVQAYQWYPDKNAFFTPFFDKLAGGAELRKDIVSGRSATEIRASWQKDVIGFNKKRTKYLLYADYQ